MAEFPPIKGFIETSFIDWKGQLSSVIFTGGCNFRCPYCHNSGLVLQPERLDDVPPDHVFATLKKYKNWVDKVVITGGEPTIHKGLTRLANDLKRRDIKVKLDTNGSNPSVLKELAAEGLVDYVAMDLKGPVEQYKRWCGVDVDLRLIEESIDFLLEGTVDYEFRMTLVPFFHKEADVYEATERIKGGRRFFIQAFRPENTLDRTFAHIKPFSPQKMGWIKTNVASIMRDALPGDEEQRV